jgi:hypothetical protein
MVMKLNRWRRLTLATISAVVLFASVGCHRPQPTPPYGSTYGVDHYGLVDARRSGFSTRHEHFMTIGWKQYGPQITPIGTIRKNPSPEMRTVARTIDQRAHDRARALNTLRRQWLDDWDLFWMHKKPLRLSMYPIP